MDEAYAPVVSHSWLRVMILRSHGGRRPLGPAIRVTRVLLLTGTAALGVASPAPAQERGSAGLLAGKPACFGAAVRDPARSCPVPGRLSLGRPLAA